MIPLRIFATSVAAGLVLMAQTTIDNPVNPDWTDGIASDSSAIFEQANTSEAVQAYAITGQSITVPAGGSIQNALNAANPGDTIILQAGATYPGGITLPAKAGTAYITITTSAAASLSVDKRVGPAQAGLLARIVGRTGGPVILTSPGAHHYRLIGLQILTAPGIYAGAAIQLGNGNETTDAQLPYDIELDRMWIHGEAPQWAKRGVALNGKRLTLKNSTVAGFRSSWQETQAVAIWNTPGPVQITNNYLQGGGMALMVGGAEASIAGMIPSDIQITGNLMSRPVAWRSESVVVKNVMELKTGRRVTITGNILENTWTGAQSGYAVNIKPGTEHVRTLAVTSGVLFANNIVRHATGGVIITGTNYLGGKVSNVTIRNNLFDDLGPNWGFRHSLFTIYSGVSGAIVENNTATPTALLNTVVLSDLAPSTGLVFRANVVPRGNRGVLGSGVGEGTKALTAYYPGSVYTNNVMYESATGLASIYPTGNYFPFTAAEVGFVNPAGGNYALSDWSTYKGTGITGQNPGISLTTLTAATAKTATGR
jgi:hypothetical protein